MATHSPSQSFRQGRATLSGDVLNHVAPSKRQANNRALERCGDDFWRNNTNRAPHRSAPSTGPPPRRNLFDFLRFNVQPVGASQPLPLQPRRRNFSLFTGRTSVPTVDIAPAQDVEIYGIAPPTEAEVVATMAAALQQASGKAVDGQRHRAKLQRWLKGLKSLPNDNRLRVQRRHPPGVEEPSYEIGCCGFYVHFGHRRSTLL
ncbi:hypothetical protein K503DRAFT_865484 [Rhizopogon vinicolor AM-OR11-026]|uniref:Uncharacterized protein n=1 Tax=Rhizopogon vinicolor AM-OR11-026 TaxID=1314800 RepID=A0A1B7N3C6_9AGAM|nr:hypothetical protein K503DRAFT_865484 [Rhizopogon vinicolor AM-OR11-026]